MLAVSSFIKLNPGVLRTENHKLRAARADER
jgi:hypothetical protein